MLRRNPPETDDKTRTSCIPYCKTMENGYEWVDRHVPRQAIKGKEFKRTGNKNVPTQDVRYLFKMKSKQNLLNKSNKISPQTAISICKTVSRLTHTLPFTRVKAAGALGLTTHFHLPPTLKKELYLISTPTPLEPSWPVVG